MAPFTLSLTWESNPDLVVTVGDGRQPVIGVRIVTSRGEAVPDVAVDIVDQTEGDALRVGRVRTDASGRLSAIFWPGVAGQHHITADAVIDGEVLHAELVVGVLAP